MLEYLIIGQLINTHGVRGELKATALTDNPERFKKLKWVYIDEARDKSFAFKKAKDYSHQIQESVSQKSQTSASLKQYKIDSVKFFKQFVILKFEGVDSIEEAEKLKGLYMKIDRENAVKLPKDSYFIADIIGLKVYDENDRLLGELDDVIQTGSNDVYIVKDEEGKEILIPALKSVVTEISIEQGRISVILPKGLLE